MSEGPKRQTVGRTMRNGETIAVEVSGPCTLYLTTYCTRVRLMANLPTGATVGMPVVLPPAGRDEANLDGLEG